MKLGVIKSAFLYFKVQFFPVCTLSIVRAPPDTMWTSYVNGPQGHRRPVPGAPTDAQLGLRQPLRASVSVNLDVVKMACPHL